MDPLTNEQTRSIEQMRYDMEARRAQIHDPGERERHRLRDEQILEAERNPTKDQLKDREDPQALVDEMHALEVKRQQMNDEYERDHAMLTARIQDVVRHTNKPLPGPQPTKEEKKALIKDQKALTDDQKAVEAEAERRRREIHPTIPPATSSKK